MSEPHKLVVTFLGDAAKVQKVLEGRVDAHNPNFREISFAPAGIRPISFRAPTTLVIEGVHAPIDFSNHMEVKTAQQTVTLQEVGKTDSVSFLKPTTSQPTEPVCEPVKPVPQVDTAVVNMVAAHVVPVQPQKSMVWKWCLLSALFSLAMVLGTIYALRSDIHEKHDALNRDWMEKYAILENQLSGLQLAHQSVSSKLTTLQSEFQSKMSDIEAYKVAERGTRVILEERVIELQTSYNQLSLESQASQVEIKALTGEMETFKNAELEKSRILENRHNDLQALAVNTQAELNAMKPDLARLNEVDLARRREIEQSKKCKSRVKIGDVCL